MYYKKGLLCVLFYLRSQYLVVIQFKIIKLHFTCHLLLQFVKELPYRPAESSTQAE
jgi:hypothetical protein